MIWEALMNGRNLQVQKERQFAAAHDTDKDKSGWDWFWDLFRNPPAPENDPKAGKAGSSYGRMLRSAAPALSSSTWRRR
jgi:hypothetical protein